MRKGISIGLLAAVCALATSSCNEWLKGAGLSTDPNNPTSATNGDLFVAAQSNLFFNMEGPIARASCIWMQQCAGVASDLLNLGTYSYGEDDFYTPWQRIYGGGGLIDLRTLEAKTTAAGDSVFAGTAYVLESYLIGTAADVWGDVPYSQASNPSQFPTPKLDPQQQVYAAIQARLDTAIIYLQATGPTNFGAGANDLVYGGDPASWLALAHTLKARYYMHTAEVVGAAAYQAALDAAADGISSPGGDYRSFHTGDITGSNIWHQYTHDYSTLLAAGGFLVRTLKSDNDPRLTQYFIPVTGTSTPGDTIIGVDPGVQAAVGQTVSRLASYDDANTAYAQPLVTWAENQLIIAEAQYQLSNAPAARSALNAVRADAGLGGVSGSLSGTALLTAIMTEKYIREFENIEAWSDYRRTCLPALPQAAGGIPTRLIWPLSERNANPNIPAPSAQPTRNWNDPNAC